MGRKPVKKQRIDNPELKEQWVSILLPIYIKQGLRKISMDEVANHLNISKATLYKHFKSREEIIETALAAKLNSIGSFKESLFDDSLPYRDRYFTAIRIFFAEISGISTEFLSDLKSLYPEIWKRVEFFREYAASQLQVFYKQGIEAGFFNDISPNLLVANDKMFFDSISDPDFLKEHDLTLQSAFRDYFKLRTGGLFKKTDATMEEHIEVFIQTL